MKYVRLGSKQLESKKKSFLSTKKTAGDGAARELPVGGSRPGLFPGPRVSSVHSQCGDRKDRGSGLAAGSCGAALSAQGCGIAAQP